MPPAVAGEAFEMLFELSYRIWRNTGPVRSRREALLANLKLDMMEMRFSLGGMSNTWTPVEAGRERLSSGPLQPLLLLPAVESWQDDV